MVSVGTGALHHPFLLPLVSYPYHRPPPCYRDFPPVISCKKWTEKVKPNGYLLELKCSSQRPAVSFTASEKEEGEEDEISRTTLIWRAAKLPIYSVALVPLTVGSAATATHYAAITSLVLGFMGLVWACAEAGDIRFILLATSAILCGYIYQPIKRPFIIVQEYSVLFTAS